MNIEKEIEVGTERSFWKDEFGHWCSRLFPVFIITACVAVLLAIPFKVVSLGYLPGDDALRHAGLAVTDKTLDQVMVTEAPIHDIHAGWHELLRIIHRVSDAAPDDLVVFEVVLLFVFFVLPPLFLHRRPESWIIGLLLAYSLAGLGGRLLFGRPYIAHMGVLCLMLLSKNVLNDRKTHWGGLVLLGLGMMLSLWWRMLWFLYLVPIGAFFLARQWRAVFRLGAVLGISTVLAAIWSGDLLLPWHALDATLNVMTRGDNSQQLVSELLPQTSQPVTILAVCAVVFSVLFRKGNLRRQFDSPVFYLLVLSWLLGCTASRWFSDFGVPALLVLLSGEVDQLLSGCSIQWFPRFSLLRLSLVLGACAVLFLSYTADEGGRWTQALRNEYVDIGNPEIQAGLPGKDGIIYNDNMGVFFQTFFRNPHAEWRYILGCEAAVMPEEDLKVYRKIQWNRGAWASFSPWVEKLRMQDRLWIMQPIGGGMPKVPELEWLQMTSYIWSGRLRDGGDFSGNEAQEGSKL